ncbi:MAG TPA: SGNH/GDSL hydrolase family protein [Sphingomicrobium sp.]|nr:SGNH/GDSL hydrolase family protein [Sphingomicrobium sp.]
MQIVLLGDSIFDNGAYVGGAPDVVRQLRAELPEGAKASLLAVDGAVVANVSAQLARLPDDASLLVVSAGGNDALGSSYLLQQRSSSVGESVMMLAEAQAEFARGYDRMVEAVVATGLPAALCTIYDANFPLPDGIVIKAALSLFNDMITRAAFSRGLPLIDLRLICSEPSDYANPIEPSERGGAKIARAIAGLAQALPQRGAGSIVCAS